MFDDLWVEKYRPKTLQDICLLNAIIDKFNDYKSQGTCPNLLFVGKAGIGKTSLAKILANDILDCQYLYINASDENGIDTIRSKVTRFAMTKSLDGCIKLIILDEVDGLTLDAQRALRNTMEEYSGSCRFVLTANYKHRVIPPLHSRTQQFDLTPSKELYVNRLKHVLTQEGVKHEQEQLDVYVKTYYPDLRQAINELQKNTRVNELLTSEQLNNQQFANKIFQILMTDPNAVVKFRSKIIQSEDKFNGDYLNLLKDLFEVVTSEKFNNSITQQEMLLAVSEYIYRGAFVLDQEINFFSCLLQLATIARSSK